MHWVWILIYVSMYLYSYLSTHGISGLAAHGDWEQFEVRLNIMIQWTQRYTPRLWLSKFGDAIVDWDWVNSEMHWEAVSEFGDAIGDQDWVNWEMHWEAVIKRIWRCNWRQRLTELRDALGGRDRACLDMQLEAEIEWTQRCTVSCDWPSLEMHLQQAMIQGD